MGENRIRAYGAEPNAAWPTGLLRDACIVESPASQTVRTTDLYSAAWSLSQRDFELNKLFNGPFDYQI